MIRIVAPLMMDKNLSVQSSAVGALRNISLADSEICEQMVIQDVMTPLCKRLLSYDHSDWKPVSKSNQFLQHCFHTFCFQTFLVIVSTVKYYLKLKSKSSTFMHERKSTIQILLPVHAPHGISNIFKYHSIKVKLYPTY